MADDKSKRFLDGKTISLGEDYEVRYWTEGLGITAEQLRDAVAKVGNSAEAVKEYLAQQDLP